MSTDTDPDSRRRLVTGIAIGALVPLLGFLGWLVPGTRADYWWVGQIVWSGVAFVGVALLFFPRTRRVGLGMLLGFAALVLVGAGVCTATFVALGI